MEITDDVRGVLFDDGSSVVYDPLMASMGGWVAAISRGAGRDFTGHRSARAAVDFVLSQGRAKSVVEVARWVNGGWVYTLVAEPANRGEGERGCDG